MIQIQEKDALWRFYQRFYKYRVHFGSEPRLPEPKNLCNYFWKAMGGAFKWFLNDVSAFIVIPILATMTFLMVVWARWSGVFIGNQHPIWVDVVGMFFFVATIGFVGVCGVLVPIFRWIDYWKGRDDVLGLSVTVVLGILFAALISTGFAKNGVPWSWRFLLYGFLIELGVVAAIAGGVAIWYFFFSDNTNLGSNILQYLKAVKGRFCPFVEPPQSYKDALKEAQLNCGDG